MRKSNFQRRPFDKILVCAGLPDLRPYDLRHTCATLFLLTGEDVKVVSEPLGHSTCRLTLDTYQHVLPEMQGRAAAKLDAIFRAPRLADGTTGQRVVQRLGIVPRRPLFHERSQMKHHCKCLFCRGFLSSGQGRG